MNKFKKNKGITLVALIITIIVLLILAVVSIRAVTNDGIISHAKNARTEYGKAQTDEQDMLSKYEYEIAKAQGTATGSYKDYLLQKEYDEAKSKGSYEGTYTEYVASKHGLGTAKNTENYGKKVVGYKSKGEGLDTLVWRVFYQDDKNTYLISETSDAKLPVTGLLLYTTDDYVTYTKKDIVEKYNSGADVSAYGQALMPKASSLFTESNTNRNIIATAYLCDTEVWDAYTDAEGKASYAIGAATIELFAASYNATNNLGNVIELEVTNNVDYEQNTNIGWLTKDQNNGIYNSENSEVIICPSGDDGLRFVEMLMGCLNTAVVYSSLNLRPVVSVPTSDFQSSYTLAD